MIWSCGCQSCMDTQSCPQSYKDDLILLPELNVHPVLLPVMWRWFDLVVARPVWTFSPTPSPVKMIWSCGCQNYMDIQSCSQLCEDDLILWLPEQYGHSVLLPVMWRWFDLVVARTSSPVKKIWSCGCQNYMDIQSHSQSCEDDLILLPELHGHLVLLPVMWDDLILWLPGHPVLWRWFDLVLL